MEFIPADSASALHALDNFAWLLMAGAAFCAWPSPTADASLRLERLLLVVVFNAATLVLWNALDGPAAAWTQWCATLLPSLSIYGLLRAATGLRIDLRRQAGAASALLGLFWINGLLR